MKGAESLIRVVFHGPWPLEQVRLLGDMIEGNGEEILLEMGAEKAATIASTVFAKILGRI